MSNQVRQTKPSGSAAARIGLAVALTVVALTASPAGQAAESGMTVVRDADTGQLRAPSADEFKALKRGTVVRRTQATPVKGAAAANTGTRYSPSGAVGYHAGDKFMSMAVATRNADGTTTMHCVTGKEAAEKLVAAPQSATAPAAGQEEHLDEQ